VIAAPTFGAVSFLPGTTDLPAPAADAPSRDAVTCDGTWPTIDQRGVGRPQGDAGRCDAGAVERAAADTVVNTGASDDVEAEVEVEVELGVKVGPIPTRIPAGDGG
jgi:hypothetical protein